MEAHVLFSHYIILLFQMFSRYKVVISHGFKKEKYVSNLCIARERRNKVNCKKKRILTKLGYDKGNTK